VRTSQRLEIQRHLAKGHRITQFEAFIRFGCCRLSERIREIERGFHIVRRTVTRHGKRFCQYRMDRRQIGSRRALA
jgi:hypothetical protein